jgi:hypothetical protein
MHQERTHKTFRKSNLRQRQQAQRTHGLPEWLEAGYVDATVELCDCAVLQKLERFAADFFADQLTQPQKAQAFFQIMGARFMHEHFPQLQSESVALGPPYTSEGSAGQLVTELRRCVLAKVAELAEKEELVQSEAYARAAITAGATISQHYEWFSNRSSASAERRPNFHSKIDGLAIGLEATLRSQPSVVPKSDLQTDRERVLGALGGRLLPPRVRWLVWRTRLLNQEHLQACSRTIARADASAASAGLNAPQPMAFYGVGPRRLTLPLIKQIVAAALDGELHAYGGGSARLDRMQLEQAISCLHVLEQPVAMPAVRTCMVVCLAMPSEEPSPAVAAMANAVLLQQAQQTSRVEALPTAVIGVLRRIDSELHNHLSQDDGWRANIAHHLALWCGTYMVGALPAGPLLQIWDRAIASADWRQALELACLALLKLLRLQLLQASTGEQAADILRRGSHGVGDSTIRATIVGVEGGLTRLSKLVQDA